MGKTKNTKHPVAPPKQAIPQAPPKQTKKTQQFRPSDLDTPAETPAPPPERAQQAKAVEKSKAVVKPAAPSTKLPEGEDDDEDDEEDGEEREGGDEEPVEGGDESDKGFTKARKVKTKKSAKRVEEASAAQIEVNACVRNRNSTVWPT
jgi:hypothetical protein